MTTPQALLKSVFGFDGFRAGQEEIVSAMCAGEPVLAIMPTGGGKSLCYQLPALMGEGLTLVISPLIALMRDQVAALREAGVAAHAITSANTPEENEAIMAEARSGEIGPVMKRLRAQGVQPVSLCITATRHFRTLYTAASDPGGAAQGMGRLRPPVFGPRRDRMLRQAQNWGAPKLQDALSLLTETDLQLRSAGQRAPEMALVERALIRLAMMAAR